MIVPKRSHVIRRLLETQAALAGLKLDIAWEVSSIGSIIDLVCAGYGHAVLTASAVAASGHASEMTATPLTDPPLQSVLCMATSAHKRPGPLMRHAASLLTELARRVAMNRRASRGISSRRAARQHHARWLIDEWSLRVVVASRRRASSARVVGASRGRE